MLDSITRMMLSHGEIFILSLIDFCINYFSSLAVKKSTDYKMMNINEDVKSECFPLWDIKKKRARYEADKKGNKKDIDSWDELCSKMFPEHRRLTPGLFIVTCCCPKKKIYGFKKNDSRREPSHHF